jgi:hypothetical protein
MERAGRGVSRGGGGRGVALLRGALFLGGFALYLSHLAPDITLIDCSEISTASFLLGNAHSPGYPVICMLGRLFTLLPWGSVAYRTNLMAAVFGAGSLVLLHWAALRWGLGGFGALLAAGAWGLGRTFWAQSIMSEVYAPAMAALLLILGLLAPGAGSRGGGGWRSTIVAALVLGEGSGLHQMLLFATPAFLVAAWWKHRGERPGVGVCAALVAAALLGLSVQLYLPLRAASGAGYAWESPSNLDAFLGVVTTRTFHGQRGVRSWWGLGRQVVNLADILEGSFGWPVLLMAAAGVLVLGRRSRRLLVVLAVLWGVDTAAGLVLFNIPESWMFFLDVFFLPSMIALAFWFGAAGEALVAWRGRWTALLPLLLLVWMLARGHGKNDRSECFLLPDWAASVLDCVPQGGILVVQRDELFALSYAQLVERRRGDVSVMHWMIGGAPRSWARERLLRQRPGLRIPAVPGLGELRPGALRVFFEQLVSWNPAPVEVTVLDRELLALSVVPRGLVYDIRSRAAAVDVAGNLEWWRRLRLRDLDLRAEHHDPADVELVRSVRLAWRQAEAAARLAGVDPPEAVREIEG